MDEELVSKLTIKKAIANLNSWLSLDKSYGKILFGINRIKKDKKNNPAIANSPILISKIYKPTKGLANKIESPMKIKIKKLKYVFNLLVKKFKSLFRTLS